MPGKKKMFVHSILNQNKPTINKTSFFLKYLFQFHTNQTPLEKEEEDDDINNVPYWTKKIHTLCTTNNQVDEALSLLDRLRLRGYRPNSLNLNSITHALCDSKRYNEAHQRFLLSIASHSVPDARTCNVLISRLLAAKDPTQTMRVIRGLVVAKPGYIPCLIIYNRIIHQFCLLGLPNEAYRLFYDMKSNGHFPNTVSYTSLINGFCENGQLGIAKKLFDEMVGNGVTPNSLTYSIVLKGVLRTRDMESGKVLMEKLWERMTDEMDANVNSAAFSNLIYALCREGLFHEVFRIAEEMPQGKSVEEGFAYGQMIDSLCRAGQNHGASRIVYIMRKKGFVPSLVSYNCILHGLTKDRGCMRAYQLFKEGIEFGYSPSEATYKVLVEALCRESDIDKAKDLLQIMLGKGLDNTRIYNIFLRALALTLKDNPSELLNIMGSMLQTQCPPNVVSLNIVINGLCKMRRVEEALEVFNDMLIKFSCTPDVVTVTTVISGLLSAGRMDEALHFLHTGMPELGLIPGIVTYNVVLRGLCQLQKVDEAIKIFNELVQNGLAADSTTYTAMIEALCGSNRIDEAKEFWNNVVWPSKVHDDFVYTAILKGLCASGKLNEACDFLYELVDCGVFPNIVSYNILIDNAVKLGLKKEAYQIAGEMRKNGIVPDSITWRILEKLHGNSKKPLCDHDLSLESREVAETSHRNSKEGTQESSDLM
ncbi:hypothetical protein IFM89_014910 [Coptis chinensis]|uniref:Pentatricopeptide repeat-containing protein n=1 Tax=Coptis chinensis TaxID=261450 RepID=A0A835LF55_9MAGN|nr:hypothetical protein IFM89_014910 [Coptis chinensis]